MTDMIDLQRAIVADHIADLEREGAALRAERDRDHRAHDGLAASAQPAHRPPRRVRIGRWLVAVGQAIAGPSAPATTLGSVDQATGDEPHSLSHAA